MEIAPINNRQFQPLLRPFERPRGSTANKRVRLQLCPQRFYALAWLKTCKFTKGANAQRLSAAKINWITFRF